MPIPLSAQTVGPTPPQPEIVVHLSELGSGRAPAGVGIPRQLALTVAAANPLASVEVWAGSELVAAKSLAGEGKTSLRTVLPWTPAVVGDVVLAARAVDVLGRTAQSNVLRRIVRPVSDALGYGLRVAAEGETLRSIAAELGADLDELLRVNPTLTADDPLAPGIDVAIPLAVALARTWIFVDAFESGDTSAWSQVTPSRSSQPGLAVREATGPSLSLRLTGCAVNLEASAGARAATGLALYRLDPDAEAFALIATAAGASAVFADLAGPGQQHYMVGAFTETTLALSPLASVSAGRDCGGTWSNPGLRLVRGWLPVDPSSPFEAAYLWLDTAEGMIRVPEGAGTIVARSPSGFDFSPWLPTLGGNSVTVTALGLEDGVEVSLGASTLTAVPGMSLGRILGGRPKVSLDWIEHPPPAEVLSREGWVEDPGVLFFRWSTNRPGITHAVWQVSAFPIPTGILDPLGVLAEGVVAGSGGDFSIDFAPLLPQPLTGLVLDTSPAVYQQFAPPNPDGGGGGGGDPLALTLSPAAVENLHLPKPEGFFIRVVPFAGDQPAGQVSNNVLIHDGPKIFYFGGIVQPPDPGPGAYTMDVSILQEPAAPVASYGVCWQFVGWNPAAMVNPNLIGWGPYGKKVGEVLQPTWYQIYLQAIANGHHVFCPSSGGGGSPFGFLGDFVNAMLEGLDDLLAWVSGAFSYIKGWVVDAVTQAVGCETSLCKAAVSLALDAALIYAGVPPTMPNFEQLLDGVKGDLSGLLVELAQDAGVPCSELATVGSLTGTGYTCEAAAAAAVDKAVDGMYETVREAANSTGGVYFPPGMLVMPDPRSQPRPVKAEITLHQTPSSPAGLETCDVNLALYSHWTPSPFEPIDFFLEEIYRRTSLPMYLAEGTHQPTAFAEAYVPDQDFEGKIFENEQRHLPEFAPGAPPTAVAKGTYWIHRPTTLPEVSTFKLLNFPGSYYGGWQSNPNVCCSWLQIPEATLRLHPDPPSPLIEGASFSVVAWSTCAGFKVISGDL